MRQLIITSDDCGLSEGINQTVHDLHTEGVVTTATLMMNCDATEHAVDMLQQTPTLRAGVHLNLTDGYPLTRVKPDVGLTFPNGRFQPRTLLFPRALFPSIDWLASVEAEMVAQIESFVELTGRKPSHLTTHMHFHIVPSLREIVLRLADDYQIDWVRAFKTSSTVIPYNFWVQEPAELFHPDNLKITPDYIVSIQAWMPQEPARLVETLMGLNGLIEIVVHPDSPDDHTFPGDWSHKPDARAREMDYILRFVDAMHDYDNNFTIHDPAQAH